MARLEQGSLCPRCSEGKVHRVHRRPWMRRFPKSKYYHCGECRARFLTICGWALRLHSKPDPEVT